jgi:hypothetical protein
VVRSERRPELDACPDFERAPERDEEAFVAVRFEAPVAFFAVDFVAPEALFAVDFVAAEAFFAVDFVVAEAFPAFRFVPFRPVVRDGGVDADFFAVRVVVAMPDECPGAIDGKPPSTVRVSARATMKR